MYRQIAIAGIAAAAITLGAVSTASATGGRGSDRCVHNYYSSQPCLSSVSAWRAWSAEQGLPADRQSAEVYQAYAERNFAKADRLLAELREDHNDQVSEIK